MPRRVRKADGTIYDSVHLSWVAFHVKSPPHTHPMTCAGPWIFPVHLEFRILLLQGPSVGSSSGRPGCGLRAVCLQCPCWGIPLACTFHPTVWTNACCCAPHVGTLQISRLSCLREGCSSPLTGAWLSTSFRATFEVMGPLARLLEQCSGAVNCVRREDLALMLLGLAENRHLSLSAGKFSCVHSPLTSTRPVA